MQVKEIMSKSPLTIEMDTPLKEIKNIFDNIRIHHVLVVDEGKLFGIISDRDLLFALSPHIGTTAETTRDLATLNKKAHQILTRKPVTISPNASIYDAIGIFNQQDISCLPVTDENQKAIGILSWRDIFNVIEQNSINKTS